MAPRILLAALVVLPLVSGCVFSNAHIRDEVDTIAWDLRPMELDAEAELQIGRGILGLASTVAGWSDDRDAEFVGNLLDDIDAVDVGVYTLSERGGDSPGALTQSGLEELRDLGWRPVVRTNERRDGSRWVLYREESGRDQMLVVGIEDEELIVLRITGRLGGLLDNAIQRKDDLIVVAREVNEDW